MPAGENSFNEAAADNVATIGTIAAALRARTLRLIPADIGLNPETCPAVFGIAIETAHPDVVASLVAMSDGSVSFYVSDGNGCIGCGSHREVRRAGVDLLQLAERSLPLTTFTDDIELPPAGTVRFYLLTRRGLRLAQVELERINAVDARLGLLYFAGQRLLAAIERVGAGQSLAQEIRLAFGLIEAQVPGGAAHDDRSSGAERCLSVGNVVRHLRI